MREGFTSWRFYGKTMCFAFYLLAFQLVDVKASENMLEVQPEASSSVEGKQHFMRDRVPLYEG